MNRSGDVFLSHMRFADQFVLRLAIGHLRTSEVHVSRAWALLCAHLDTQQHALGALLTTSGISLAIREPRRDA